MSDASNLIDRQMEQYRRGQILGFTMAEIMLILLFLLLLLLGTKVEALSKQLERSLPIGSNGAQIIQLISDEGARLRSRQILSAEEDDLDLTRKLILAAEQIVSNAGWTASAQETIEDLQRRLEESKRRIEELEQDVASLTDDPEQLAGIELAQFVNDSRLGLDEALACLRSCGSGPDACWGESLSDPDFIYNVGLFDNFFFVEPDWDSVAQNRLSWDSLPPDAKIEAATRLTPAEFRRRFSVLNGVGVENECVFQVRLIDADTSTKEIYKLQRQRVEGHVYATPFREWSGSTSLPTLGDSMEVDVTSTSKAPLMEDAGKQRP